MLAGVLLVRSLEDDVMAAIRQDRGALVVLSRIRAVALSQARELSRRRVALLLLVLLLLAFYTTSGSDDFAPVFASVGVGWAFTLFLTQGMRHIEPRLALVGYRSGEVLTGRPRRSGPGPLHSGKR